MNDPIELHEKVREVLAMAPTRRFTEQMIFDAVERLVPETLTVGELKKAMLWNQTRGFIDFVVNPRLEREEWSLTDKGKGVEGLV